MITSAMTSHAQERLQQRAIPSLVLDLLKECGSVARTRDGESLFFDKVRLLDPVQVFTVAFGNIFATSSNVITAPNFGKCDLYSSSFETPHSRAVSAAACGRTALGADVTQHCARSA